jgi:hypothetical protein
MYRNLEIFSRILVEFWLLKISKKKALDFSTFYFKFNLCFWLFLLPGVSSSASSSSSTHMTSVCCSFLLLFPLRFHVVAFCYLVLNSQQLTLHNNNNNNKICGTRTTYCSRRAKDLQQLELADQVL